jgi:hypothetical protein
MNKTKEAMWKIIYYTEKDRNGKSEKEAREIADRKVGGTKQ